MRHWATKRGIQPTHHYFPHSFPERCCCQLHRRLYGCVMGTGKKSFEERKNFLERGGALVSFMVLQVFCVYGRFTMFTWKISHNLTLPGIRIQLLGNMGHVPQPTAMCTSSV